MQQCELKAWIENLIAKDELWKFYKSKEWIAVKENVLKKYHHECAVCRSKGIITRYDIDSEGNKKLISTVHHQQFVRKHPELALSETYVFNGKRYQNLIPVCKACHNKLHPEKWKNRTKQNQSNESKFVNEEKW